MPALILTEDPAFFKVLESLCASEFKVKLSNANIAKSSDGPTLDLSQHQNVDFDFFIIDLNSTNIDVQRAYNELMVLCPQAPFMLYGQENLFKARAPSSFYDDHSGNCVVYSPLVRNKLLEELRHLISFTEVGEKLRLQKEASKSAHERYIPLKIKNVYRFETLPYDAYIHLGGEKFIKMANKDDVFAPGMIYHSLKKGIQLIYIEKTQHSLYLQEMMDQILAIAEVQDGKSVKFQKKAFALIQEYIRAIGVNADLIKITHKLVDGLIGGHNHGLSFYDTLLSLPLEFFDVAERSLLTAICCFYLSDHSELSAGFVKKKLALASVVHDCLFVNDELAKIDLIDVPNLREKDQKEVLEHPLKASKVAELFSGFSETEFIIAQHHEHPQRKGFPYRLGASDITPLSALFILSRSFVNEACRDDTLNTESIKRAYQILSRDHNQGNFRRPLNALKQLIKD
jgi:hypothetical protein